MKFNKTIQLSIHCNFCRIEMKDLEIDNVIIDVDLAVWN